MYFLAVELTNATTVPEIDNKKGEAAILDVGDSIRCISQGWPEPTYKWYTENMPDVIQGSVLSVTDKMVSLNILKYKLNYQWASLLTRVAVSKVLVDFES